MAVAASRIAEIGLSEIVDCRIVKDTRPFPCGQTAVPSAASGSPAIQPDCVCGALRQGALAQHHREEVGKQRER